MIAFLQKIFGFLFVAFHSAPTNHNNPTGNNPAPCGTVTSCVVNTPEIDMTVGTSALVLITGMGMVLRGRRKQ